MRGEARAGAPELTPALLRAMRHLHREHEARVCRRRPGRVGAWPSRRCARPRRRGAQDGLLGRVRRGEPDDGDDGGLHRR